jgi:hypothetical protein
MSKLANHIALFCSHDNTGYIMVYINPVIYSYKMSFKTLKLGLDSKSSQFDQISRTWNLVQSS